MSSIIIEPFQWLIVNFMHLISLFSLISEWRIWNLYYRCSRCYPWSLSADSENGYRCYPWSQNTKSESRSIVALHDLWAKKVKAGIWLFPMISEHKKWKQVYRCSPWPLTEESENRVIVVYHDLWPQKVKTGLSLLSMTSDRRKWK